MTKAILLRVSPELMLKIDEARKAVGLSRCEWIRGALVARIPNGGS